MLERDDIDLFDQKVRHRPKIPAWFQPARRLSLTQSVRPVSDGASGLDGGREAGADEVENAGEASQNQRTSASA